MKGLHKNSLRNEDNPHQWMIDDARMELIQQIKAEVERLKKANAKLGHTNDIERYEESAYGNACDAILSFLDTLQEQPVKTNIVEDLKHYLATTPKEQIKKDWESLKEWDKVGPSVSEFLGWEQPVKINIRKELASIEFMGVNDARDSETIARHFYELGQQSKPKVCKELEEEMDKFFETMPVLEHENIFEDTFKNIARHFAQWQKEQTEKRWLEDRDGCFWDGVEEGKKAMKEQFMKGAVEVHVSTNGMGNKYLFPNYNDDFKDINDGDKVRILIVKED